MHDIDVAVMRPTTRHAGKIQITILFDLDREEAKMEEKSGNYK
jgi:hypothetical protein